MFDKAIPPHNHRSAKIKIFIPHKLRIHQNIIYRYKQYERQQINYHLIVRGINQRRSKFQVSSHALGILSQLRSKSMVSYRWIQFSEAWYIHLAMSRISILNPASYNITWALSVLLTISVLTSITTSHFISIIVAIDENYFIQLYLNIDDGSRSDVHRQKC